MLVAFLLAALLVGGDQIQISIGLPAAVAPMLQGTILFFLLGGEVLTRYRIARVMGCGGAGWRGDGVAGRDGKSTSPRDCSILRCIAPNTPLACDLRHPVTPRPYDPTTPSMTDLLTPAFLISVLAAAIPAGTAILFACLGELLSERAGVLNLGVEGMMLMGALGGAGACIWTGSAWVGAVVGAGGGRGDGGDPCAAVRRVCGRTRSSVVWR